MFEPFSLTKRTCAILEGPLWGPLHAPHHWRESIFGYYLTRDEAVLRKHAQMLSDAGIDAVIFDVTNQITYREDYMALLRVRAGERELGNRTPQVAFLTPFWAPEKVTRELWRDLYSRDVHRDLWFTLGGKPLIFADPALVTATEEHAEQNVPAELPRRSSLGHLPANAFGRGPLSNLARNWNLTHVDVVPRRTVRRTRGVGWRFIRSIDSRMRLG